MAYNTSILADASALTAALLDPTLNPPASNALSATAYPDARLAFLLAGGLLIALLCAAFAGGCACLCCRALDVFSSELWVSGEAVLEAPPAGHEEDPRYAHGAKAAGFTAHRKGSVFGGVACLCGVVAGLALAGDTLMGYALNAGCVGARWRRCCCRVCSSPPPSSLHPYVAPSTPSTLLPCSIDTLASVPALFPAQFAGVSAPLTLNVTLVSLTSAAGTCGLVLAPRLAGPLGVSPDNAFATASAAPGSYPVASGGSLPGCAFSLTAPALTPFWPLYLHDAGAGAGGAIGGALVLALAGLAQAAAGAPPGAGGGVDAATAHRIVTCSSAPIKSARTSILCETRCISSVRNAWEQMQRAHKTLV